MAHTNSKETSDIRHLVQSFIDDRLAAKLEKLKPDDPKYQELQMQFQYENWITDAAKRVTQLQVVTHSLKAVHPDAKGTNLFVSPSSLPQTSLVSSYLLQEDYMSDVVGNAAALDVYKFLKLEYKGTTLLELALSDDPHFIDALNDDPEIAQQQAVTFAGIVDSKGVEASSPKAKQVYWLVGDDPTEDSHYHLLSPLYPTSLVHKVYQCIQRDRFGEEAKAARKARREQSFSEQGFHDYPNLAVQKLGGTKPQNISQLNSERSGTNYLLASLPPRWQSISVKAPLNTDSVFPRFGRYREVRWLVRTLQKFLKTDPPKNVHTRLKVNSLVDALIEELVLFAARFQILEPGWSAQPECRLAGEEKLWLDGWRSEIDEDFKAQRTNTDWADQVRDRFAKWMNKQLSDSLPVGDPEHHHWMKLIRSRLNAVQEVLHG